MHGNVGKASCCDVEGSALEKMCSLPPDPTHHLVHFYVHVPNGENNTYEPCEKNVAVDPNF